MTFEIVRLGSSEYLRWIDRSSKKITITKLSCIESMYPETTYKDAEPLMNFRLVGCSQQYYTTIKFSDLELYLKTPVQAFI